MAAHISEDIEIERDGLTLHGRVDHPEGVMGAPVVIAMHGFMRDLGYEDTDLLAQLTRSLVDEGFMVVRFDFNGRGKSQGSFAQSDVFNQIEDAIAVLEWVRKTYGEDVRISLLGHSQGGLVAGMVAGLYADVVDTLVMLAPAASLKDDALRGQLLGVPFDPNHVPAEITLKDGEHHVDGKVVRIAQMLPVYETTALFKGPALLVMGEDDQIVGKHVPTNYAAAMLNCATSLYTHLGHPFTGADRGLALGGAVQFLASHRIME
ncbi:alpha/beta hydrolase family protein [Bifidobacterium cuniculi]|uniref:Cinnamoyl ester hydrolase n=1 Tax=Bifidobacterium cuniculi TaxID=1688 RepID=A0A087ADJ3_9BIFI|nr:alpha/beta fold hydrolase [Bifidobacterium cuniculi]KFI56843.1 cinnamoyl ester hydrolase [Bifidobacterium cuniculi]